MHSILLNTKYLLYLDRALNSWGDRCWEFAIGLYLIKLNTDSLLLSALQGILASCLSIIIVPYLGRWISTAPRLKEIAIFLFAQNFGVFLSSTFVALYFVKDADFLNASLNKLVGQMAPFILVIFSSLAQVFSFGYTLALEKDWIIAISTNDEHLSELNANLRRIDLIVKTIAPLMIGFLMEYSNLASALFLMGFNVFSGFFEYLIMRRVYNLVPDLAKAKKPIISTRSDDLSNNIVDENDNTSKISFIISIECYLRYFALPGISFGLLYLSVLGFDSIAVGFVTSKGVSESTVGLVSVLGALTGVIGTMFYQFMTVKRHSSLNSIATIGYLMDILPLSLCLVVVVAPSHLLGIKLAQYDLSIVLFLIGITLSRIGLWSVDLSTNQMIQTKTPNPPLIGGIQNSVNTFAELTKFVITALIPSIFHFYILIVISFCSILTATFIFTYHTLTYQDKSKSEPNPDASILFTIGNLNVESNL